jgi:hypothetical protein
MRVRTLSVAGIGTAALVFGSLASGAAPAVGSDASRTGPATSIAGSGASLGGSHQASGKIAAKGLCGTKFGTTLPTPDGVISWNDTTGTYDTAGAADFKCKAKTTIKKVSVKGYNGSGPFNVTIYKNSTTTGSNEPDDANIVCQALDVPGAAGGAYPTDSTTVLKISGCTVKKGTYWASVQNNQSAGPWYWEMQVEQQGAAPDWRDTTNVFGSGCTTFDNDRYLLDCLGYDYGDWMLKLS